MKIQKLNGVTTKSSRYFPQQHDSYSDLDNYAIYENNRQISRPTVKFGLSSNGQINRLLDL